MFVPHRKHRPPRPVKGTALLCCLYFSDLFTARFPLSHTRPGEYSCLSGIGMRQLRAHQGLSWLNRLLAGLFSDYMSGYRPARYLVEPLAPTSSSFVLPVIYWLPEICYRRYSHGFMSPPQTATPYSAVLCNPVATRTKLVENGQLVFMLN
jgi:hypothetical protein